MTSVKCFDRSSTKARSIWTPKPYVFVDFMPKPWTVVLTLFPLCCSNSFYSSGNSRFSTTTVLLRFRHWCWVWWLGSQSVSVNPKGQSSSSTPNLANHILMGFVLSAGALSSLKRKFPSPKVSIKLDASSFFFFFFFF